jgi:hypothetical protein
MSFFESFHNTILPCCSTSMMNLEFCWQCGAPPEAVTVSPKSQLLFAPHRLLTSNDVPLDSETPCIHGIISEGQNQIHALNSQIDNLVAAIARLTHQRDKIAEHVIQHRAIISPVRRVPPELICEILALSLSSDNTNTANSAPWHIGHICRFWRHCVLAYPVLWSSITIPSSSPLDPSSMIETQLIRSANAPLDVIWSPPEDESTPDPRAADLVLSHSNRWRVLLLNELNSETNIDWLHAAEGRLAALETLEVRGGDAGETEFPDIFLAAPNLRKVLLADWDFAPSPTTLQIPWAQITHYSGSFAHSQ